MKKHTSSMVKCSASWLILNSSIFERKSLWDPYSSSSFLDMFSLNIDLISSWFFLCSNMIKSMGSFPYYLTDDGISSKQSKYPSKFQNIDNVSFLLWFLNFYYFFVSQKFISKSHLMVLQINVIFPDKFNKFNNL